MSNRINFLKWLFFIVCVIISVTVSSYFGLVEAIFTQGNTSIVLCSAILILFMHSTFTCGCDLASLGGEKFDSPSPILQSRAKRVWNCCNDRRRRSVFVSGMLPALGFFGTVLGMIYCMEDISLLDPKKLKFTDVTSSIQTAMYTTAVGLACQIILRVQCYLVESELRRLNNG